METWQLLLQQLEDEFLFRENELALLHRIDLRILGREQLGSTLAFIADETSRLLGADCTHIELRRGPTLKVAYSSVATDIGQEVPIDGSITGESFTGRHLLNVDLRDPKYRDRYIPIAGWSGEPIMSMLAVPIYLNSTPIGVLNSESIHVDAFASAHERLATTVGAQVGLALEHSQLFDNDQLFSSVDQLFFADEREGPVLQQALDRIFEALLGLQYISLTGAQILFVTDDYTELEVVHSTDPTHVGLRVAIDDSVSGMAIRERRTIVVRDVEAEPAYRRMLGAHIQSEIAVPILMGSEASPIGVLNVESSDVDAFTGFYELLLDNFARRVRGLLALVKLRADVTEALELRHVDELLVAVGDQASNMVHRINNTVGAMRVRLKEVKRNCATQLEADDFLNESVDALLHLAEKTLEMPRELQRFLGQDSSLVDVNSCITAVLDSMVLPETVELQLHLDDSVPRLPLYSFDIVVQNLVRNALDAMPAGGRLSITTSRVSYPRLTGLYVELVVADSGVGISADARARLFDINFTTKASKAGKGLGLGLWWVRNFVRRARGEIEVAGDGDGGTRFVIKIPVTVATYVAGAPISEEGE